MSWVRYCLCCATPFEVRYVSEPKRYCNKSCAAKHATLGRNRRHGMSFSSIHEAWCSMRKRCNDPDHAAYKKYGGRGIRICERWDVFENFYADMGDKPGKRYSLDRIDNNGNYEPGNCRWATPLEQTQNRECSWTPEQDEILRKSLADGLRHKDIIAIIGKSSSSISARCRRLKLKSRRGAGGVLLPVSEHFSEECKGG